MKGEAMEQAVEQEDDPTIKALMEESFGPSEGAPMSADRIERGLDKMAALSTGEAGLEFLEENATGLAPSELDTRLCFRCGTTAPASSCARCGVAGYCSRECQTQDWGKSGAWGGHKKQCAGYKVLGRSQVVAVEIGREVISAKLTAMRLYICPFAVYHGSGYGSGAPRGFLFVQFSCSLAELALPVPRDCAGRSLEQGERAALVHFVREEFDEEISGSDDRLASMRTALVGAVESHDDHQKCVVLTRTRCGYTAVLLQQLVPEWRIARALADDCAGHDGALQIDLDDL